MGRGLNLALCRVQQLAVVLSGIDHSEISFAIKQRLAGSFPLSVCNIQINHLHNDDLT